MAYVLCLLVLIVLLWIFAINIIEIKKHSKGIWNAIGFALAFPILLSVFGIILVICPILLIYRIIISCILTVKHGYKFYGFVNGLDLFNSTQELKDNLITVLLICEFNADDAKKDIFQYIKEHADKCIFQNQTILSKFFVKLQTFAGYLYMEKINLTSNDCVHKLPTVNSAEVGLDKIELTKLLSRSYFEPLRKSALWDINVGTQPLKWKKSNDGSGREYYPILFRVHHVVADGITLMKLLSGAFADKRDVKIETFDGTKNEKRQDKWLKTELEKMILYVTTLVYMPSAVFTNFVIKAHDSVHRKPRIGEETLAFALDELGTYFRKVKNIKKSYSGVTFPDVVISAFIESFKDYFAKHAATVPNDITIAVPVVENYTELQNVLPGEVNLNDLHLNNRYILLSMKIPLSMEQEEGFDRNNPLISRLNLIVKLSKQLKTSVEYQVNYIIMQCVMGILPISVLSFCCSLLNYTTGLSLIPGPPKFSYCNGVISTSDCVFWIPHILDLRLYFSAFTFDNRLQLAVNCNASFIPNQEDAQEILDNTYKYIDILEQELDLLFK